MGPDDKPALREIRRANHLADVLTASREFGIDDAGLMDAIRRLLLGPIGRERERRRSLVATTVAKRHGEGPPPNIPIPDAIMELVVATGDLSKLSSRERMQYYAMRCEAAGLDPRTGPFQYITFKDGKLALYATKTATDQLIASRKLTVEITDRRLDQANAIFKVQVKVKSPDGVSVEDFAAVSVEGLRGDPLCNALMKTVTKATRRAVLKACGLGELDESEVEVVPGAQKVTADLPFAPPPPPPSSPAAGPKAAPPDAGAAEGSAGDEAWGPGRE